MNSESFDLHGAFNPGQIRDQIQEQTDRWVDLTLIRLHQLRDARWRGDSEAAERAELALVGALLMTGNTLRGALKRVRWMVERIDTTTPEALIPRYWRTDVTMFHLMDKWRKFLGCQQLHGIGTGVKATRTQLFGALLACGLPSSAAVTQLQHLEYDALMAQWMAEGGASTLVRYAILHALEK
jgi:hypothetical protein